MAFTPNLPLSKFQKAVENYFSEGFSKKSDEDKYKEEVARVARKCRSELFGKTIKQMQADGEWEKWIAAAEAGFDVEERDKVLNFNENTVSGLGKCNAAPIHAFAFHYRLHRYAKPEQLVYADILDRQVFGKPYRELEGKSVFQYSPDEIKQLTPNAPFSFPPYKTEAGVNARLALRADDSIWLDPHNHHSIPNHPRIEEEARLDKFMQHPAPLRICPVIGPSGAGKTRLVSQWMFPYVPTVNEDTDWEAGFIVSDDNPDARNPEPWHRWEIDRNTLIVIDYTHAFDAVVKAVVKKARGQGEHKVRLVVIDHVMPTFLHEDFFWKELGGGHASTLDSLHTQLVEPPVELHREGDGSQRLRHIIAKAASLGGKSYAEDDPVVIQAQQLLDRMGQAQGDLEAVRYPLFAALMGQAIREAGDQGELGFTNWSRRDLMAYYFKSHDRLPWQGWDNHPAKTEKTTQGRWVGALVAAATLRRGLAAFDVEALLPKGRKAIIQQANRIVSDNNPLKIKAFLPDILGETFLLKFLMHLEGLGDGQEAAYAQFIGVLSSIKPEDADKAAKNVHEVVARLARNLANDDPVQADVIRSWRAFINFLDPERFEAGTALRLAVSFAIPDVLEQLAGITADLQARHDAAIGQQDSADDRDNIAILHKEYQHMNDMLSRRFGLAAMEKTSRGDNFIEATEAILKFTEFTLQPLDQAFLDRLAVIANNFRLRSKKNRPSRWSQPFGDTKKFCGCLTTSWTKISMPAMRRAGLH